MRDKVVAPMARHGVGHAQDQAGTAQPLQVGDADLAQAVVPHPRRPGQRGGGRLQAVAALVHENQRLVGFEIDQVAGAGAVKIGQQHPRCLEPGI